MARASSAATNLTDGEKEALALPGSKPATGTATVTVFCKWGPGLILRAGKMIEQTLPSPLGSPVKEMRFAEGKRFHINGPAAPFGMQPRAPVVGGYAITRGVPKDLWDSWYEANKEAQYVVNRLIYAEDDETYGRDKAFEHQATKTGFEPLNPAKDDRAQALQNSRANPFGFGVEAGTGDA